MPRRPNEVDRRDVVKALALGLPAGALAACRMEAPRAAMVADRRAGTRQRPGGS